MLVFQEIIGTCFWGIVLKTRRVGTFFVKRFCANMNMRGSLPYVRFKA